MLRLFPGCWKAPSCYYTGVGSTTFLMTAPGQDEIEKAVSVLRDGGVIAMPTDTLYALTARARDGAAVRRVFEIKGRNDGKPMPLFVSDLDMARRFGEFNETASRLAERFWPGALTLVVRRQHGFESDALAGGDTVALRAPDNAIALAMIAGAGEPVTGTSANLSGGPDPVSADEVRRQIGDKLDVILDAGPAEGGVGSTIVDCIGDEPVILREGALSRAEIFDALRG
jgi:L-threonylcarbamoyladenylate synthase